MARRRTDHPAGRSTGDLLAAAADSFEGNGDNLRRAISGLRRVAGVGAASADDLTAIVVGLDEFTQALSRRDALIRRFATNLTETTAQIADERHTIRATITELSSTLTFVARFVRTNKALFVSNVDAITRVSQNLLEHRKDLESVLDVTPLAFENLGRTIDPQTGRILVNANLVEVGTPQHVVNELCAGLLTNLCDSVITATPRRPGGVPLSLRSLLEDR